MKIANGIHALIGATMYEFSIGRFVFSFLRPHMIVGILRNNGLSKGMKRMPPLVRAGIDRYGNWRRS